MGANCPESPLWEFKTAPEDTYAVLDNPNQGIALVEMPNDIDPQGLVNRLADLIGERHLGKSRGTYSYHGPESLMLDTDRSPDNEAVKFDELYEKVYKAVITFMEGILQPFPLSLDERVRAGVAYYKNQFFGKHPDSFVTATWLGVSAPGLTIYKTQDTPIPVDEIPANHLLFTRQAEWDIHNLAFGTGTPHTVDWRPKNEDDFRLSCFEHWRFMQPEPTDYDNSNYSRVSTLRQGQRTLLKYRKD